jgi:thiol-disulfide isomerase/thioredoxin
MKFKNYFPGEVRAFVSGFWKEYKLIIIVLALGISMLITSMFSFAKSIDKRQDVAGLVIAPVVNYKDRSIRLSALGDKLIILDFWATYCPPCRRLLPLYDSIQREMGDKVQFILVTHEDAAKAATFLKQSGYILPSAVSDVALSKKFPHHSIPHEVWIRNNKVIAVTFGEDVTRAAILRALQGAGPGLAQKADDMHFNESEPLLVGGNGGNGPVIYQSMVTPYNPALNSIAGLQHTPRGIVAFALNASPLSAWRQAFRRIDPMLDLSNRYIVELPDSLREVVGDTSEPYYQWVKKYGFCYSLVLPPAIHGDVGRFMLSDLNRFFENCYGITAKLEQRKINCLVISRIPGAVPLGTKGGEPKISIGSAGISVRNTPFHDLVMELAYTFRRLPAPLVDETGYTQPVDIEISGDASDIEHLQQSLKPYGLELHAALRSVTMVVITRMAASHQPVNLNP